MRKLIDEASGEDRGWRCRRRKIRFAFGAAVLTSKLIDGTFPDYERVIPTHNDKQLDVDCKRLRDAVDRVSAISIDRSRAVKLTLANGTLELVGEQSRSTAAPREELEVTYHGDAMEIGFNSRYLLDIAEQIERRQRPLRWPTPLRRPSCTNSAIASAIYVLMPMRV